MILVEAYSVVCLVTIVLAWVEFRIRLGRVEVRFIRKWYDCWVG